MKLAEAKLCIECDEVFSGPACPSCGKHEPWKSLSEWVKPLDIIDAKTALPDVPVPQCRSYVRALREQMP